MLLIMDTYPLPVMLGSTSRQTSAMFDQASLYGNNYMMVIIDTKSKYAWDYYLKTKDEAYDKICEWLEHEIGLHRGGGRAQTTRLHYSATKEKLTLRR